MSSLVIENRGRHILPFVKDQISSLFAESNRANFAQLGASFLVLACFSFLSESGYILWFVFIQICLTLFRFTLTQRFKKDNERNYNNYVNVYAFIMLLLGLNWAILNLVYYDVRLEELRTFLSFVSLGLITAAIGSLAFWMPAYYGFSIPIIFSLIVVFVLNGDYFVSIALIPFGWYLLTVAKQTNIKFKHSRILILDNIELIDRMDEEIRSSKRSKDKLENYKKELEDQVEERTSELVEINRDLQEQIEQRSKVEKDLEHLAYYDVLTGLANRSLLIERLKQAVSVAKRNDSLFAVLFVDLDRFKTINDSLGHALGDKLLMEVAYRLRNILRESDTIARNGGDEFVIVAENLNDVRESFIVSEKIISAMSEIFKIDGHDIHIGASIGVSIYPIDATDALELLKMSDTAMYCAKENGSNRFEFYSSHMSSQIKDRLELENALRTALLNKEFFLVYQPQVDISSGQTVGLEALLRWRNPELGFVSPIKFIPVLEETGLIYEVGEWVIEEVCEFIRTGGAYNAKVSINLSALQCGNHRFSETINQYLTRTNIKASQLEFEITESLLINDFKKTEKFLKAIHELGCTIALDDFGTGYTSFSYLSKLPIDIIKIDRSLVSDIHQQKNLQDIVYAIVTMCQSLKVENIFEGVETKEELDQIDSLGGRVIQGYFFSKPLEKEQLATWFSD